MALKDRRALLAAYNKAPKKKSLAGYTAWSDHFTPEQITKYKGAVQKYKEYKQQHPSRRPNRPGGFFPQKPTRPGGLPQSWLRSQRKRRPGS